MSATQLKTDWSRSFRESLVGAKVLAIDAEVERLMDKSKVNKLMTPSEVDQNIIENNRTDAAWKKIWDTNIELNQPYIMTSDTVRSLFQTAINRPALICGAGPSVRKNFDNIRYAQEKGMLIIAVDRIHGELKMNGIKPDYTCSCDAGKNVLNILDGVEFGDKFVIMGAQDHEFIENLGSLLCEPYYYFPIVPNSHYWQRLYRNEEWSKEYFGLRAHSVVGGTAIDLAVWLGSPEIYTIGCELSWEKPEDMADDYKTMGWFEVETADGRKLLTIPTFFVSAVNMQFYPKTFPNIKFFDLSKGIMQYWNTAEFKPRGE